MLKDEFLVSMKRITAFYAPPKTEADAQQLEKYLDSLYESCAFINADTFDHITKKVILSMDPRKKPMPKKFHEIYYQMTQSLSKGADDYDPNWREKIPFHEHVENLLGGVRMMTPRGARFTVDLFDKFEGHNMPGEVVSELAIKAADAPDEPGPMEKHLRKAIE